MPPSTYWSLCSRPAHAAPQHQTASVAPLFVLNWVSGRLRPPQDPSRSSPPFSSRIPTASSCFSSPGPPSRPLSAPEPFFGPRRRADPWAVAHELPGYRRISLTSGRINQ